MDTEELRRRIPTVDVVATDLYGIDWRNNQAHCPHGDRHKNGDKNPSLRYDSRKKRIFCASQQCFGEKGVDVFGLVMYMENCNFAVAKRKLQAHYGVVNGNGHLRPAHKTTAAPVPKKQLVADVRAKLENDGFRFAAEFLYGDDLRKIRFEHGTEIQADKGRPKKTFLWEHLGDDGTWYTGAGSKQKPLYVNRVFNNRDQSGLAVGFEGEGKADLAGELGFAAFSYKEMSEESARTLVDWDVVLWRDADAAGTRTCTKAAESILKAGARSVAVAHPPPDIPNSGDIIDAVSGLGWTAEDISRLISGAQPFTPVKPSGVRCIAEVPSIRECGSREIKYLDDPLLPVGSVIAFTGDSGSGKSTLLSALAGRVSSAGVPVLVLDKENPIAVVLDRFDRLGVSDGPLLRYWGGWLSDEAPQPGSPIVLDWVRSCEPKPFVIVDSLVAFHGGDENDASAMRAFMHQCRKLADLGTV